MGGASKVTVHEVISIFKIWIILFLSILPCRHFLHRTDLNMDGKISSDELKAWVASIRHDHAVRMSEERLAEYDSNNDGVVSMKEYFDAIYGNNQNLGILSTLM